MRTWAVVVVVACAAPPKVVPPPPPAPPAPAPVATPTPPPDPPPPAFRLPGDVTPLRYRLELTIVPDGDRASGAVHVDATVVKPTRVVWLNARDLHIATATLDGHAARVIAGGNDAIGLVAHAELTPGPLAIDIAFDAPIDRQKSRGIYAEREGNDAYVYTFFEPIDARRAFPCFDEPAYKVPWQLVFHVRRGDVARGNAPIARESDEPNDMKRVELIESKPLPSYLVAFVVGPFEIVDDGLAGRINTPISFIVPKGRAGELDYAKQITPKVVTALEDYFDMAYPYGKLDVAVVPRFWGTMEHPGIVAMGQPLTLIRADQRTHDREQGYANILAHELSHYWFGDYVTLAWWDDTWLNEALGEWSDMNITDAVAPQWRYRDERVGLATFAMSSDETLAAKPIRHAVTTNEQIQASFDNGITYFKGSSVLRAIEALVGPEKFRDFIRAYVHKHAWGNATAGDFVGELRAQLGAQAADTIEMYTTRAGVPRVDVRADCTGAPKLVIDSSRRALPAGVVEDSDDQFVWPVPVCVRYGDATHAERACGTRATPIEAKLCPTWIIPNADANGYYRSVVDAKLVAALFDPRSAIAKSAKPSSAEKMMAVADLRAMVDRGELDIDKSLALAPAILADADPRLARWAGVAGRFRYDVLDDKLYAATEAWFARVYGKTAHVLGWHRAKTDTDDRHQLRQSVMWRLGRRDPALRAEADKLADKWLADRTGIDDDMVDAALYAAASHGDAARFERVLAAAKAPRDRTEVQRLTTALGRFTDPALAKRALALALGTDFDLRDSLGIVYASLGARETRDLALAFVTEHIDELLARMRDDEASWFLGAIAGEFCDATRRKAAADLVTPRATKYDGASNAVAQGLERADQCIAEVAREMPGLQRFLKK